MRKAFTKLMIRQITFNLHRYLSILLICALGVSFYAGLRSTSPNMKQTADLYYNQQNVMDFDVRSPQGFSTHDIESIKKIKGIDEISPSYSSEALIKIKQVNYMLQVLSYNKSDSMNQSKLVQGRLPQNDRECLMDKKMMKNEKLSLGDEITLDNSSISLKNTTYKIVGIVNSPLYISIERGYSTTGEMNGFVLIDSDEFQTSQFTNVYLTINKQGLSRFSNQYEEKIKEVKSQLLSFEKNAQKNWVITDLTQNIGFSSYKDDTTRIAAVGNVFPLIFFLVSSLVTLTTMTRMVEQDRTEIGTLKSLGYGRSHITRKYLFYALTASILGGVIGYVIGVNLFPQIIYNAYGILYELIPLKVSYGSSLAVLSILVAILAVVIPAYFACLRSFKATPAHLMRPKAPEPGKRIFLEKMGFIWKRLKFIQKVTARNLFRYKKRFFMTIIGIGGCTALLFTGFGLKDSISSIIDKQFQQVRHYDAEIYLNQNLSEQNLMDFNQYIQNNQEINDSFYIDQESISIDYQNHTKNSYLIVPHDKQVLNQYITLRTRTTHEKMPLNDHEVIITEKVASLLHVKVGSTITLTNSAYQKVKVKVSGIVENYVYHYVFMSKTLYESLFHHSVYYNVLLTKLKTDNQMIEKSLAKEIMNHSQVQTIHFISQLKNHFINMINTLNDVVYVLIISAALLAFLVLFTLSSINIDERKRELATIKVLGFYDKEVSSYIHRENYILTIMGIILGLVLGFFLHRFVIVTTETDIVMFSRQVLFKSYLYSILLTIAFALTVNFIMHFRTKKIDMIESLKNVE